MTGHVHAHTERGASADDMRRAVVEDVREFRDGAEAFDDPTILVAEREPGGQRLRTRSTTGRRPVADRGMLVTGRAHSDGRPSRPGLTRKSTTIWSCSPTGVMSAAGFGRRR
jgi:hypothetical protein